MTPEEAQRTCCEAFRQDPYFFMSTVLGERPWKKQIEIMEAVRDHRRVAIKSAHSCGKSWVSSRIVLWFMASYPECVVVTTAPTDRQVKSILWKEIGIAYTKAERNIVGGLGGELYKQRLLISPTCEAVGFTASNADSFQGFHAPHALVVVDEACGVAKEIYEAIDSVLSAEHIRQVCIGNPTDVATEFGSMFKAGSDYHTISISAFDTPNFAERGITEQDIIDGNWEKKVPKQLPRSYLVTPQWVADMYKKWGPDSSFVAGRIKAEFPSASDKALVPSTWIFEANKRHREIEEGGGWSGPCILGVDVARYGEDKTVIAFRRDQGIQKLKRRSQCTTTETVNFILGCFYKTDYKITEIRVDADGVGAGVYDRLCELLENTVDVREMRGARTAIQSDRYANQRAEWAHTIKQMLAPDYPEPVALPPDEELEFQLSNIQTKENTRELWVMETKDQMRSRGLKSPDEMDAVAMAFAPTKFAPDVVINPSIGFRKNPYDI